MRAPESAYCTRGDVMARKQHPASAIDVRMALSNEQRLREMAITARQARQCGQPDIW